MSVISEDRLFCLFFSSLGEMKWKKVKRLF